MKKFILTIFVALLVISSSTIFAQTNINQYEVEILSNPTKGKRDTREVNSVAVFYQDRVTIKSRRTDEIFKEINYSDIKSAEHSFSKRPWLSDAIFAAATAIGTGFPSFRGNGEKHWLAVVADKDFFILKLENDNYRQIKAELEMRDIKLENISEDRQKSSKKSKKDDDGN